MAERVDLDELESLSSAATQAPWCEHPNGTSAWRGPDWETINNSVVRQYRHVCNATSVDAAGLADIELIVAMRNALDPMLAELRSHRAREASGWVATSERLPVECWPVWFIAHGYPHVVHKGAMGADDFVNESLHCWRKHEVRWWKPRYAEPTPKPPETP